MSRRIVDYDRIAEVYDQRYASNRLEGVAEALEERLAETEATAILEVGCGTGRWLSELAPRARFAVGLDRSLRMLLKVPGGEGRLSRICGCGERLPLRASSFDFVVCVNVLHHLVNPSAFVAEAARLIRPGGALALVGLDPHSGGDRWYLYEYFPEARTLDLQRYPSVIQLQRWMSEAGLETIEALAVERIERRFTGGAILEDYFLHRNASSQLALLTDEAWARGLGRIRKAVENGETLGVPPAFEVDLKLNLVCGRRSATGD